MSYLENVIKEMENKKTVFWGAGRRIEKFIKSFCVDKKIMPLPDYVCDSVKTIIGETFFGINILPFEKLKKMNPNVVIIIITAGFFDFYSQVIKKRTLLFSHISLQKF
jgi:hypothetical protein